MYIKTCPHCNVKFTFESHYQFGGHVTNCKRNPKHREMEEEREKKRISKLGIKSNIERVCPECNRIFVLSLRPRDVGNFSKDRVFCCRKCANKYIGRNRTELEITIPKCCSIRYINCGGCGELTVVSFHRKDCLCKECRNLPDSICAYCNKPFKKNHKGQLYCSNKCFNSSNGPVLAGIKSSQTRQKRSKNEIYFSELCQQKFANVLTNAPMFNGWDADVILPDIKVAVMWNGPWHYEKITQKHSLLQVQNRDKIKVKEIYKAGYIPFIVKDMGKYNKKLVEEAFRIFCKCV